MKTVFLLGVIFPHARGDQQQQVHMPTLVTNSMIPFVSWVSIWILGILKSWKLPLKVIFDGIKASVVCMPVSQVGLEASGIRRVTMRKLPSQLARGTNSLTQHYHNTPQSGNSHCASPGAPEAYGMACRGPPESISAEGKDVLQWTTISTVQKRWAVVSLWGEVWSCLWAETSGSPRQSRRIGGPHAVAYSVGEAGASAVISKGCKRCHWRIFRSCLKKGRKQWNSRHF